VRWLLLLLLAWEGLRKHGVLVLLLLMLPERVGPSILHLRLSQVEETRELILTLILNWLLVGLFSQNAVPCLAPLLLLIRV